MSRSTSVLGASLAVAAIALAMTANEAAAQQRRFSCADYRGLDMGLVMVTVISPTTISAVGPGGRQTLYRTSPNSHTYAGAGYVIAFSANQQQITMTFPGGRASCFFAP